jgi:hypothetical protein
MLCSDRQKAKIMAVDGSTTSCTRIHRQALSTFQSIQKLIYCEGCIHRATVLPSVFYRRRFKPPSSLAALKTANTHVHHLATIFAVQPICSVVHACL